ncbi:LysR family transcriptional regulator [Tropicimonas sediminicola]|uniref:DNA-binding transcriptional regulator, LysR family n=1 Tax=Tropicimonas sediminicola TaxID=1031541 RepID=A0A239JAT6_9RHOB|nr:LysR family transcriptional regulator [Tropicimonas sediminicola]SNT02383.1 DNA-binding transcriptional regulator, LysR family [Tropicimonas sediminicola]
MDINQLKCFLTAAETLHFGRAAQALDMLPATLGRQIRQLEEQLGVQLFQRTTRAVSLTETGSRILEDARKLVEEAEAFERNVRTIRNSGTHALNVGAIDSAAAGLMPQLLQLVRQEQPDLTVQIIEQKTIHLLPKLLSGSIDLAFCRPPDIRDPRVHFMTLFYETAVVALPSSHALAGRERLGISDLEDEPLIVPDRRSRPHSHDLTIKLFVDAGLTARIAQVAEEKQTIVNLVAAGAGLAIVPRWTSRLKVEGVTFVPLAVPDETSRSKLVLAVAWARGTRDPLREAFMSVLKGHLEEIEATA